MAKISTAEIKRRAKAKNIEIYRERGKTVVVFESGKTYRYNDALTDVALRIELINESEHEALRNTDKRHAKELIGLEMCGKLFDAKSDWSAEWVLLGQPSVCRVYRVGQEVIKEAYI